MGGVLIYNKLDTPVETRRREGISCYKTIMSCCWMNCRLKLLDVKPQIDDLADAIGLNPLKEELSQLEGQTAQEGFWNDLAGTQKILQRISRIKDEISLLPKIGPPPTKT